METLAISTETELIRAAQAGDGSATEALLEAYAPGIKRAARRFAEALGPDDAAQEAVCAFLECVRDFDTDGELKLVQVFGNKVLRALGEAAANGEHFKVPQREYRRYLAVIRDHDGDVAAAARNYTGTRHLSREMFLSILAASRGTGSLDESREGTHADVADENFAEPLSPANPMYRPTMPTPSEIADVHYALSVVDDRERYVCRFAYGFAENRPMSDAEVADVMPIPTERGRRWTRKTVNDVRNSALAKMRAALLA